MENIMINALTIDVEDAINQAMRNFFKKEMEPTIRVLDNTIRLLDLFDEKNVKGTFFVLGEVAKTYPNLIKDIANRGHELGIHGYSHARYYNITKEQARQEIVASKEIIEDISGKEVLGHRAPEFSINKDTIWVLELLLDAGLKYDSSIFPAKSSRYGWSGFEKDIHYFTLHDGRKIIEAPMSAIRFAGKDFPVCGGGYFRILPFSLTDYSFNKIQQERPVNVYLHPYEVDTPPFQDFYMEQVSKASFREKIKLKTYWYNRDTVVPKLSMLLDKYKFDTLYNVISNALIINN
ncbi:MAG: DUF3473 domain-containing protein [Marinilabiliaceae bacterium]|nr:DUF3473 domain-containing protein [Marinilabiliaceae bacterium]